MKWTIPAMTKSDDLFTTANAVRVAVGVFHRRVRDELEDGVSPSQTVVLSRLDRNGPESIVDLARRERVTPQAMGSTVASLEARGLLDRTPDPNDGRRVLVSPTPEGHRLIRSRQDAVTTRVADALAEHFEPTDIEQIRLAARMIEQLAHFI
ncbi:DNA-binding MarR family transcriptional regulator [Frondihabitans sp. PhB188]|nr:DNA-binding MarR family transcriptional regulator [Frondihabitans sp. PhB188]